MAKSSDSSVPKSSSVPKLATPSKAKKPKTGSVPRAQIPTRPAKRATEEATADTADTEEGIMEYEAELKIRKIRLDDYRSRDKRWQQFDIKAPETIQFELTQEEKFVESFFEEVLKRKGPIHISCVEDYFKENKALLEEAVPSLRTFHNLLQLLLNRSCCFVLMDSVLGLAANVVDLYKTTKENAGIRFKIPPKKEPQHSVTIKTTIPTVVNAAEPFIPYKKNSLNPELARSQCPGFTGGILKDLKLSVADFKRLTSIELDFKPSARVSSHVGASKKRTFDGQQSASTDPFCKVSSPSEESQRAAFTGSLPKPPTSLGKSPALIPTQIPSTENNFDKVLMAEKKSNEILDLSEPLYIWEQDGWSELPPSKPLKPEETKCAVAKPLPNVVEDEKAPLKDCVKEFIQTFLKNTSMHEVQKTSLNASEPRNSSVSLTLKQEEQETLGISELESPHVPSTLKQEELEALLTVSEPKSSRSPTSMQEEQKTLWDVSEPKNSSVSSIFDGNNVDVISQGPFKPIPNSAPTPDTETKTPESYEERQELLAEKPCIRSLSEVSSNENNKLLSEDNDKDVSTDVSSECFIDKLVPVNFNSEETGTEEVKEKSQSGTSDDYLIPAPTANIPDDILHLHVPNLPVVNPEPKTTTIKPPISAFFDVEAKPSELLLPNKSATLEKDQLIEDSLLFEECTEDLFVIEDKDRCLIDDIPLDLSPVQKLVWNLKDLPDNGDLFAIDTEPVGGIPPEMDLFQVPGHKTEHVFSNGFDPPKPSREISLQRISKPPVRLVDGEDIFKTEDRWKLKQEQIDFVRLSFPREKYSRLIEGLSKIHDKRGPEVDKMALEDIVKELSDIFQLTPCDQQPSDGDGSTGNLGPQTRSTDTYKEDENWEYGNSPWKPSLLLVQVVRLSFPTEEFYKLMFALYLAKLYSDTTRFEELCDRVANVLSDINEGKCQDYNNEISIHGPYNEESRIIYGKAWRVLISTGSKANSE